MSIYNQLKDEKSFDQHQLYTVEQNKKIIDVLNSLVQINNDRIEGYGRAAEETDASDLKALFNGMMDKSQTLKIQLVSEIRKCGGEHTETTTTLGKAFRIWMDFKAAITGKDRKAILASCEFGEEAAQETYAEAIKESDHLPADVFQMISDQKSQLGDDLNQVMFLISKQS